MREASRLAAGWWSGSDTHVKPTPIWASGRDASGGVCANQVARNFFLGAVLREQELLAPLPGCFEGGTKPVVSLTLDHRLQAGMPPASRSGTRICFFVFASWVCSNRYPASPSAAGERAPKLTHTLIRPPSLIVRGLILPPLRHGAAGWRWRGASGCGKAACGPSRSESNSGMAWPTVA